MIRWKSLLLGAATFAAAHAVQAAAWTTWFHGVYAPWFLNSGRAVAFTAACLLVAGMIVGLGTRTQRESIVAGCNLAAGAVVGMAIVLLVTGAGGNLFPIAFVVGTVVISVSSVGGALAAWAMRSVLSRPYSR